MKPIPNEILVQLQTDLDYVTNSVSFDGILLKIHLDTLIQFKLPDPLKQAVEEVLKLYKFDGRQCYSNEDRPRLSKLLGTIVKELQKLI